MLSLSSCIWTIRNILRNDSTAKQPKEHLSCTHGGPGFDPRSVAPCGSKKKKKRRKAF